jgi:hypothetical protein
MTANQEATAALAEHDRYLAQQIAHCERKITYWQRRLTMLKAGQDAQRRLRARVVAGELAPDKRKGPAE